MKDVKILHLTSRAFVSMFKSGALSLLVSCRRHTECQAGALMQIQLSTETCCSRGRMRPSWWEGFRLLLPLLPGWVCRDTHTCTRLTIQRLPQRTTHTLKDCIHTPRLADRDTPTDAWWDRHEDTVDLTPWLSTQEVGGKARQRDAAEIKEEMGFL